MTTTECALRTSSGSKFFLSFPFATKQDRSRGDETFATKHEQAPRVNASYMVKTSSLSTRRHTNPSFPRIARKIISWIA
jgi:hypothetical protein